MNRDPLPGFAAAEQAALPAWPAGWYAIGRSADLPPGRVRTVRIAGEEIVVYRDAAGALAALDAHCPHMGTHLGRAAVTPAGLRCPLHHWTFDRAGRLHGSSGGDGYAARTRPVLERFGLVFVGAGTITAPFADAADDHRWIAARPFTIPADWRAVLVNGFDTLHLRIVHQRAITDGPTFRRAADGALRMRYRSRVLPGGGWSSWLTGRLAPDGLAIDYTCYGPTMLVESRAGRHATRAVFGLLPRDDGGVTAYGAFGVPRGARLGALRLRLARALYIAFLRKDFAVVENMRLRVDGVDDPAVQAIAEFLRSLPDLAGERSVG